MAAHDSLGAQLRRERLRRFVGRAGEVELLRGALAGATDDGASEPSFRVLFVQGPGGVGKTTLLEVFAAVAADQGASVVRLDGRLVPPTRSGVLDALGPGAPLAGTKRPVLLIDTFEMLEAIEDWIRDELMAVLPEDATVVIAGRNRPGARWLADPAWRDLLRVVSLRNLTPEDTRAYLAVESVSPQLHNHLQLLSHGHPLTLSLLVDAVRRRGTEGVPDSLGEVPDLVGTLLASLVDAVPTSRHRAALEVAAHARFTTEELVRAVLEPGEDAGELFAWLRTLPFVDEGPYGLYPHDVVRDLLDADLRWRNPDSYAALHRRVRAELVDAVGRAEGKDRQRRIADTLFVVRSTPLLVRYFEHFDLGVDAIDDVRPADHEAIVAMTRRHQGDEQAELVGFWLDRQPDAFQAYRHPNGTVAGFSGHLRLHVASPTDLDRDPGARALWDYSVRHGPARSGEQVLAWRFVLDDEHGLEPSPTIGLTAQVNLEQILAQRQWAWDFIATYQDEESWTPVMDYMDFGRAAEADYEIGGHRYLAFAHDWRRVGVAEWLERSADLELGMSIEPPHPHTPDLVLSQPEFAEAVRAALRDLHAPDRLARGALVRSRLVRTHRGDGNPAEVLRALLEEAAATLRVDPREHGLYDVINRTFLRPAPTQERAAEMLHLSFSTYRRHRDRAVGRMVEWLWRRELHGSGDHGADVAEIEQQMDSDRPPG